MPCYEYFCKICMSVFYEHRPEGTVYVRCRCPECGASPTEVSYKKTFKLLLVKRDD